MRPVSPNPDGFRFPNHADELFPPNYATHEQFHGDRFHSKGIATQEPPSIRFDLRRHWQWPLPPMWQHITQWKAFENRRYRRFNEPGGTYRRGLVGRRQLKLGQPSQSQSDLGVHLTSILYAHHFDFVCHHITVNGFHPASCAFDDYFKRFTVVPRDCTQGLHRPMPGGLVNIGVGIFNCVKQGFREIRRKINDFLPMCVGNILCL